MRGFEQIVDETLPTLEGLENDRQLYLKRRRVYLPVLLVPLIGLVGAGLAAGSELTLFIGAGVWFVVGTILYQVRAGSLASRFKKQYKLSVIPRLLQSIDSQLEYSPDRGLSADSFVGSELYTKRPDRYRSEDLIHGKYGATYLQLAEIHAEERQTTTDSKGHTKTRYVTIFRGLLLLADFHKHFSGRTFVLPDTAEKLFGRFGRHFQKFGGRRETDLVHLEDPEFERLFATYSTDEVECRYILSTSMMRRLLEMRERFGKDVRVGFKDSNIVLAVPHSHAFLEPSTSSPATDDTQVKSMLHQLRYFLDTVEELDLNTRIWSKR